MNIISRIKSKTRILLLRLKGAKIGNNCYIGNISILGVKNISIGNNVHIEDNVRLKANIISEYKTKKSKSIFISDNVFIGYSSVIDANLEVSIGKNCMIGPLCFFTDSNHIHHLNDSAIFDLGGEYSPTIIKENCWFGTHCIVLKGIVVEKNSVFAANTTVTKNTDEGSIYMGCPAKKYK